MSFSLDKDTGKTKGALADRVPSLTSIFSASVYSVYIIQKERGEKQNER